MKHTTNEIKQAVERCLTNGIFSECKGCIYKDESPCIPALVKNLFNLIDNLENENRLLRHASDGLIEKEEKYVAENKMLRGKLEYVYAVLTTSCDKTYSAHYTLEEAMNKVLDVMDGENDG